MANKWNGEMEDQTVTRVLRRKDTAEYFDGNGWTADPAAAKTFCDVVEAAETCCRHKLTNVELALRVEPDACDVFCTSMC